MNQSKKQKYYVVFIGKKLDIYYSWDECKAQTDEYPNNCHHSFKLYDKAQFHWLDHCRKYGIEASQANVKPQQYARVPPLNSFSPIEGTYKMVFHFHYFS